MLRLLNLLRMLNLYFLMASPGLAIGLHNWQRFLALLALLLALLALLLALLALLLALLFGYLLFGTVFYLALLALLLASFGIGNVVRFGNII